jgi:VanZ family protein
MISRCNSVGFRLMLGLALVIITTLALMPDPQPVATELPLDKITHLAAFLVLAWLTDAGWPEHGFVAWKWLPLLAYGLAIEVIQIAVPGRFFDLADLAADGAGLALYGLAALPLLRRLAWR